MLVCFGFYNVRADASRADFVENERRNAQAYRAGCRTFGWENLGSYACVSRPSGGATFGHVHPYAITAADPDEAMRAAEAASGPPGFADIVAAGQAFLTSQDDTAVVWFHPAEGQPDHDVPLGERAIVVAFGADTGHAGHAGSLGRFQVEGPGWLLTPVVGGVDAIAPLR